MLSLHKSKNYYLELREDREDLDAEDEDEDEEESLLRRLEFLSLYLRSRDRDLEREDEEEREDDEEDEEEDEDEDEEDEELERPLLLRDGGDRDRDLDRRVLRSLAGSSPFESSRTCVSPDFSAFTLATSSAAELETTVSPSFTPQRVLLLLAITSESVT